VNLWSQENNDLIAQHTPNLTAYNDTSRINIGFYFSAASSVLSIRLSTHVKLSFTAE
jgi:hypothetical protein